MQDTEKFDNWSETYGHTIAKITTGYPFEGYHEVLESVQNLIIFKKDTEILDIGMGTGLLSYPLYEKGAILYGIDFSEKMLDIAKNKMPEGLFYRSNIKNGIPEDIKDRKFDYIISSYTLHHLTTEEKIEFLLSLKNTNLKKNGSLIIADISFQTSEDLGSSKKAVGKYWDDDECYIVVSTFIKELKKRNVRAVYNQVSVCAGILTIK